MSVGIGCLSRVEPLARYGAHGIRVSIGIRSTGVAARRIVGKRRTGGRS
jgi:hypothetical protein